MVINESMKDTNRMAIRLKSGAKVVIKRHYLENKEYYVATSDSSSLFLDSDNSHNMLTVRSMVFDENDIRLYCLSIRNMAIESVYYNNDGVIDVYERSFVPEPEDPVITSSLNLFLDDVDNIITDEDMFKDMLSSNIINAPIEILDKYGLVPLFSVIKDGKVMIKQNKHLQK